MNTVSREEFVPDEKAIWQSDTAKTYQCPFCFKPVHSQYERADLPEIACFPKLGHVLTWAS